MSPPNPHSPPEYNIYVCVCVCMDGMSVRVCVIKVSKTVSSSNWGTRNTDLD